MHVYRPGFHAKGEPEFLMNFFDKKFHIKVEYINARERFISKLKGITDPEQKRKIIGKEFIRVFEEESNRLGPFQYLAQGLFILMLLKVLVLILILKLEKE